jgi:hypothetical protein
MPLLPAHLELSLLQIEGVEPLTEPAVDRGEKIASLLPLALIAPESCHTHRRAQFPGFCLLLARNCEGAVEIRFRFRRIRLRQLECDFPGNAMDLGLARSFLGCFHRRNRFTNAAPSVIDFSEFRICACQK